MTSWSTITMNVDEDAEKFTGPPTGLQFDSGNDEIGFTDDGRLYALSYGRYQYLRYEEFVEHEFVSPRFNGVEKAVICSMNDTGDTTSATVYQTREAFFDDDTRIDGMSKIDKFEGSLAPEKLEEFEQMVEDEHGIRPVITPPNTTVPPDAVLVKNEES